MKRTITQNFRGMHGLVVHPDDANRRALVATLGKLGLTVSARDTATAEDLQHCDLMFLDADEGMEAMPEARAKGPCFEAVPCIALIGNEAPSRLARVVRRGCASHILKPIRNSGVYAAILLAVNSHELRQETAREIGALRKRLTGRRIVTQAVVAIMNQYRIDQDKAYEILRVDAMNRRLPIDQIARERMSVGRQ